MARLSAFYFGEHGPIWAATASAAQKRIAPFASRISGPVHRRPASAVPRYLTHWRILTGRAEADDRP